MERMVCVETRMADKTPCTCGASNCKGVIGQRKRERNKSNGQEAHGLPERGKSVKVSIAEPSIGGLRKGKKGAKMKPHSTAAASQRDRCRNMDWQSQRDNDATWQD